MKPLSGATNISNVVNLSTLDLSPDLFSLLNKGLSFIPTHNQLPVSDVLQSTARLTRNIAIKKHFENTDQPFDPKSKSFCLPSTWTPKPAPSTAELLFQIDSCVVHCIRKHRTKPQSIFLHQEKNLSPGELQALHTLKNNKAIVIKPADKGGSVVVMDKTAYLTECYRQLEDTNYYQPLTQPTFSKNVGPLNNILNDMYRNR